MNSKTENSNERIEFLEKYFLENFIPVEASEKDIIFMSTNEIYNSFYSLFPSDELNKEMLFSWLMKGGFKFIDMGKMQFEWMLHTK